MAYSSLQASHRAEYLDIINYHNLRSGKFECQCEFNRLEQEKRGDKLAKLG